MMTNSLENISILRTGAINFVIIKLPDLGDITFKALGEIGGAVENAPPVSGSF